MIQRLDVQGVEVLGEIKDHYREVLSSQALHFLASLHRSFNRVRLKLLAQRQERQHKLNLGEMPDFLKETATMRQDPLWKVAAVPADLERRRVEITGPTDSKMLINALNSGADVFMADFEDANSPTWENMVQGQVNLIETIKGSISFESPEGKKYALNEQHAVLLVRPRGWHLNEKHFLVDGEEISGSLFDFGLYFFHNAKQLLEKGSGPYFYLPKLESHLEARLWNEVFLHAQKALDIPKGTIRATVLIETILAAFEMEEILYELREHASGLNAGRWDYIFSIIKKFHSSPSLHLPDRGQITMAVPFMRSYTELLVKTCHKRGAHAMGGMAAFIPNRKDPEVTEKALRKVREDKLREVKDGFDGTWVAHPDLVPIAGKIFDTQLSTKPHQKERLREDVEVTASELLNFTVPGGNVTLEGLKQNIHVALLYLSAWLSGRGAAAIDNLMEDVATAEISRSQLWQWLAVGEKLEDGTPITQNLIERLIGDESASPEAQGLFAELVFSKKFIEFLTLPAYQLLE